MGVYWGWRREGWQEDSELVGYRGGRGGKRIVQLCSLFTSSVG